jgi:hypothetical protein
VLPHSSLASGIQLNEIATPDVDSASTGWRATAVEQSRQTGSRLRVNVMGDLSVTQNSSYRGRISGSFDNNWGSFFDLNLNWNF